MEQDNFLEYCPECGMENTAIHAAMGVCAYCGYEMERVKVIQIAVCISKVAEPDNRHYLQPEKLL